MNFVRKILKHDYPSYMELSECTDDECISRSISRKIFDFSGKWFYIILWAVHGSFLVLTIGLFMVNLVYYKRQYLKQWYIFVLLLPRYRSIPYFSGPLGA